MVGRRIVSLALVAAVSLTIEVAAFEPAVASATTCADAHLEAAGAIDPPSAAKGAKALWTVKAMHADDWDEPGTPGWASEVLWVGTNDEYPEFSWVEVGALHGWQGQNIYAYYTAHELHGDHNTYVEFKFSKAAATGQSVYAKAYQTATNIYRAEIVVNGSTESVTWSGHSPNTVEYLAGSKLRARRAR